jgi:hypothetical protein
LKVECLFVLTAAYHAPDDAQCQRADAERGERAHEDVRRRTRHREPGAKSHIGREAERALRQEREQGAGQYPPDNSSDATPPGFTRIVTGARLSLAGAGEFMLLPPSTGSYRSMVS